MTLPDVADLRHPDGLYADPAQLTKLARFFQNANSGGVAASLVVKATAGLLLGFTVSSVSSQFVQVFDLSAVPANTAVPALSFDVTALTTRGVSWLSPRGFKNGIVIANSSTQHTLTIGSASCIYDVQFLQTVALVTGGSSGGAGGVGATQLVYRLTVAGADKASIDTGVDTPDAGSNNFTNGDLLEVWMYLRCDEALTASVFDITVNNDSSAIYDRQTLSANNATVTGSTSLAQTSWQLVCIAASETAGFFSTHALRINNYLGTVGNKTVEATTNRTNATAGRNENDQHTLGYRATTAITRIKIVPDTAAKKFIVGSQLLIYKRLSA